LSFANPLGLLLLLSVPAIVLLHLFRQERRRQEVSSIYLWREISDQHSRRVRPRLLRNLNLLLQVIMATLASLALAQPVLQTDPAAGAEEIVILIDDSASMQTDSDGVPHMDLARNRAREIIGRAPRNARILLASAGPRPSVIETFTVDRTLLYERLRTLEATDGANNLRAALNLVRGLGADDETDVVLVTDGALSMPRNVALPRNLSTAVVGETSPARRDSSDAPADIAVGRANRAITSFELRSRPDGSAFEVLAAVANYASEAAEVVLELTADEEVISSRTLEVAAGEERIITATIPRTRGTVYAAELVGNEDALAVDDRAFAAASGDRPVRVQLVTAGNLFLESFLSVYPNVQLTTVESVDQTTAFDVLILDEVPAPARLRGNVVALGTALPDGPFTPGRTAELDRTITVRDAHPIVDGVRLDQVQVGEYIVGDLNPRASVLASAGEDPLLYTYRANDLTLVATTFPLTRSDIALRGSFPVLMHNILEWLAPVAPSGEVGYVEVGSVVPLYVPPGEEVVIVQPDGTPRRYTPRTSPFEFSRTEQIGVYQVRGESFAGRFAVSLANAQESNLSPRLQTAAGGAEATLLEETAGTPIWQWLALAALLFLAADWVVWARRH
jgi:hypothetical protein